MKVLCPILSYKFKEITTTEPGLYTYGCPVPHDASTLCGTIYAPTDIARFTGGTIPPFEYEMTITAKGGQ